MKGYSIALRINYLAPKNKGYVVNIWMGASLAKNIKWLRLLDASYYTTEMMLGWLSGIPFLSSGGTD